MKKYIVVFLMIVVIVVVGFFALKTFKKSEKPATQMQFNLAEAETKDLMVGNNILVIGSRNDDGSINAEKIMILSNRTPPANNQDMNNGNDMAYGSMKNTKANIAGSHNTSGEITEIENNVITLKTHNNESLIVHLSYSTVISKTGN